MYISITALLETIFVNILLECAFQYNRNQEPLSVNQCLAVRDVQYSHIILSPDWVIHFILSGLCNFKFFSLHRKNATQVTKLKKKLMNKIFFRLLENNKKWLFQCTYHNSYFSILHRYLFFFHYRHKGQNMEGQSRRNIQLDLPIICLKQIAEENILIFVLRKMLLQPRT